MNDTTLFFGTGWDPYYPPPGQEKKQPVVPEPATGWMIGTFVLLYGTVLLGA